MSPLCQHPYMSWLDFHFTPTPHLRQNQIYFSPMDFLIHFILAPLMLIPLPQ